MQSIYSTLGTKNILRLSSLLISYLLWSIIGHNFITTRQITIPLCFYNMSKSITIDAPAHLVVQLKGKRSALYSLNKETLAAHIDAQLLTEGNNALTLSDKDLLLPLGISLDNYKPNNLVIAIKKK